MSQADASFARLAVLTSLDRPRWERILAAPPEIQTLELANYRDQDWSTSGTSTFDEVIAILQVLGTIAGVVGGVAGAAGAVSALRNIV